MAKEKYHIEYIFERVSTESLWREISTALGLSKWFSDKAIIQGESITFSWYSGKDNTFDDVEEMTIDEIIPHQLLRLRYNSNPETFIEFVIHTVELTGVKALEITDFCDPRDLSESINLWDIQINKLHRVLGAE